MTSVTNTDICPRCGEEFWYELDCRTFEYTVISECKCDRIQRCIEEFLKDKGLLEDFQKYVDDMEKERVEEVIQ
jgi:hypothetical protein